MRYRTFLLGWALLAATACDRGASLYKEAAEAEQAGQPDDARFKYQTVVLNFPQSGKFADAERAFVRLSLDAADKAIQVGDVSTSQARLGEAQPHLSDQADKDHFNKLMAAQRSAKILADQSEAIRQFVGRVGRLATEEAKVKPNIEQQAAFKWDEFVVPDLKPAQRINLHLGRLANVDRRSFEFGNIKRVGDGQYVVDVVTETSNVAEQTEWFLQITTNGWRIVCAQKVGVTDCKDPWVYKPIKGE